MASRLTVLAFSPANAVTVWLAVFDTDEENAAMKVVSGSHKLGKFVHITIKLVTLFWIKKYQWIRLKKKILYL